MGCNGYSRTRSYNSVKIFIVHILAETVENEVLLESTQNSISGEKDIGVWIDDKLKFPIVMLGMWWPKVIRYCVLSNVLCIQSYRCY